MSQFTLIVTRHERGHADYHTSSINRLEGLLLQSGYTRVEGWQSGQYSRWQAPTGGAVAIMENNSLRVVGGKQAVPVRELFDHLSAQGEIVVPPCYPQPLASPRLFTRLPTAPCEAYEAVRAYHDGGEDQASPWPLDQLAGSRWREVRSGREVAVLGLDFHRDRAGVRSCPSYLDGRSCELGEWQEGEGGWRYVVNSFARVDYLPPAATLGWLLCETNYLSSQAQETTSHHSGTSKSWLKQQSRAAEDRALAAARTLIAFAGEHQLPMPMLPAWIRVVLAHDQLASEAQAAQGRLL